MKVHTFNVILVLLLSYALNGIFAIIGLIAALHNCKFVELVFL